MTINHLPCINKVQCMYKKSLERIFLSFRVERQKKSEREREKDGKPVEVVKNSAAQSHTIKNIFFTFLKHFFSLFTNSSMDFHLWFPCIKKLELISLFSHSIIFLWVHLEKILWFLFEVLKCVCCHHRMSQFISTVWHEKCVYVHTSYFVGSKSEKLIIDLFLIHSDGFFTRKYKTFAYHFNFRFQNFLNFTLKIVFFWHQKFS